MAATDRVDAATLARTAAAILVALGVPEADAARTADNLVTADLRGVETHGLMRLKSYVERLEAGGFNPRPTITVVRDEGATGVIDGDNGLGAVVGAEAMRRCIDKAREYGVGIVVARNLNHYGAAAYYSTMPTEHGMIGWSTTNVPALMAPTGGTGRVIGNNPMSFAFPSAAGEPVVWDSAMSASTFGAALLAQQHGQPLAEGAFLDDKGEPTRDPDTVFAGGTLLPIAGYKGYGLALSIALMTGVLGDWRFDNEMAAGAVTSPGDTTALMGAIDVAHFSDVDRYRQRVEDITVTIRAVPRREGVERVMVPGEKEAETRLDRAGQGVPVTAPVRADIEALAARLGVPLDGVFA